MSLKFRGRQPKISELPWKAPPCVVNGDYEYGCAVTVALEDRRRLIRAK
jgi:hypothetical protein